MTTQTQSPAPPASLALHGGPKAFPQMVGREGNKIGVEEFFAVARRFGFSPQAMARLQSAVTDSDLAGTGPNFARYATPFPAPPVGVQFEDEAREKFGAKHALSTSSGTGALHAAMIAVGAAPGKEIIVPAVGFMATGMAAALTGATVVMCDVDQSMQIDPAKIEALITDKTVAIAPTHHWGGVAAMDRVMAVAARHKLRVIEDCAQCPGARYRGKYVGAWGDIACFSISAYKIIGAGEGGLLITSDDALFDRARQLAEGGGLWRPDRFAAPRYDGELFPGTNYRMSELEAAIDLVQLRKLDAVVARFQAVSRRILSQLRPFSEVTIQRQNDPEGEIGYLLRLFPQTHELAARIAEALGAEGIRCGTPGPKTAPDWHLASFMFPIAGHIKNGIRPADYPVAHDLYNRGVYLWLNQWYSPADCDAIAAGINKVLTHYCTPS